jgi:hypothetical protein
MNATRAGAPVHLRLGGLRKGGRKADFDATNAVSFRCVLKSNLARSRETASSSIRILICSVRGSLPTANSHMASVNS